MADQPSTMDGKPLRPDDLVFRIVSNSRPDVSLGRVLPNPDQFSATEEDKGMSVWIDRVLREHGNTPEGLIADVRKTRPHARLVSLSVNALAQNKLRLVHDGKPVPWHANVFDLPEEEAKLETVQQALSEASAWVDPTEPKLMYDEFDRKWAAAHKRARPDRNVLKPLADWLAKCSYSGVESHRRKVAEALDAISAEAERQKKVRGG